MSETGAGLVVTVRRPGHGGLVLLAALTAVAYANVLGAGFQFDDFNVIADNPDIHSRAALLAYLPHGIRPLLKLRDALLWSLGGGQPLAFHACSVVVHLLNTGLVWHLGRRMFERCATPAPHAQSAAVFGAALFAVLPVNTEAVTYVSGSSVAFSAMFMLASLAMYDAFLERGGGWRWLACFGFFLGGLAARETAATLPVLLLLWDALAPSRRGRLVRHAPFWLVLIAGLALAVLRTRYDEFFAVSLSTRAPWDNALAQIRGLCWLLAQALLLRPLDIDPDLHVPDGVDATLVAQAALLALLLLAGLVSGRRWPWAPFCAAWGVLHFLPTNSLLPRLDLANDRQWYLPGIAACWTLGYAIAAATAHAPRSAGIAAIALLSALAWRTHERNLDYADEPSLWRQTLSQSPDKPRVLNNYGVALRLEGRELQARAAFLRALAVDPTFEAARKNLDATTDHLIEDEPRTDGARARFETAAPLAEKP
ncbi:ArnT family glycosyltransferase [Solimonas terrae]|uniref:Glycosyltransferase family 39 protein n=1 Tax=Solimonas terrae TaxID=1396819 RepID=A0A6M2BSZ9_9GAMM|nr:glycosyltransferase family 39 protein [Solimonas terrae]NGY05233.1 glycosyltransferase family 39 protein [Solimonas terrae]